MSPGKVRSRRTNLSPVLTAGFQLLPDRVERILQPKGLALASGPRGPGDVTRRHELGSTSQVSDLFSQLGRHRIHGVYQLPPRT